MLKYLTFMCAIAYQRLERRYYALLGGAVPKNISTLWGFFRGVHVVLRQSHATVFDRLACVRREHHHIPGRHIRLHMAWSDRIQREYILQFPLTYAWVIVAPQFITRSPVGIDHRVMV